MATSKLQDALFIQFARAPVAGRVKTRMLPVLSAEEACDLHRELVLWTSRTLTAAQLATVEMSVAGDTRSALFQECQGLGVAAVSRQQGADLGQRMYRALQLGLQRFRKVVLVGSDCPQLDRDYLAAALSALDDAAVVLGPALDGGYVLIGVRELDLGWFEGVSWGQETVYAQTISRLDASSAAWHSLKALQDIDRPEDLPLWQAIAVDQG